FEKGVPVGDLKVIGETEETGTVTTFAPDPTIFTEGIDFDLEVLTQRLRELAFLNKGLTMSIEDKRTDEEPITFMYEGGISSYVEYSNHTKEVLHEPFYAEGEEQGITVEVSIQDNDGFASNLFSFANNIHTHDGGTHEFGFRTGLTRVINDYARRSKLFQEDDDNLIEPVDRVVMSVIVAVKYSAAQFERQWKTEIDKRIQRF